MPTLDWAGAFGKGDLKADLSTCSAPITLSTLGSRAFLLRSKLHTVHILSLQCLWELALLRYIFLTSAWQQLPARVGLICWLSTWKKDCWLTFR